MKILLAAALLSAALPAFAQNRAAEIDFDNARAARAASDRSRALQTALVAMNDGPEAGGAVMRLIEEKKISVELATQPEAAKTVTDAGRVVIRLSDALPAHPRVYAPLVAAEAAKLMLADMPASAERSYMRGAIAARAFAELGGSFKSLPVVDGDRADAVKDAVAAWTADAQTALNEAGRADGVPLLADIKPADAKAAADVSAADRRFIAFLLEERDARREAAAR